MAVSTTGDSKVRIHIKTLYCLTLLLLVLVISGVWLIFSQIERIRTDLNGKVARNELVEFKTFERHKEDVDTSVYQTMGNSFDNRLSTKSTTGSRRRRETWEGSGAPDDWVWLSSFSRIPVSVSLSGMIGLSHSGGMKCLPYSVNCPTHIIRIAGGQLFRYTGLLAITIF